MFCEIKFASFLTDAWAHMLKRSEIFAGFESSSRYIWISLQVIKSLNHHQNAVNSTHNVKYRKKRTQWKITLPDSILHSIINIVTNIVHVKYVLNYNTKNISCSIMEWISICYLLRMCIVLHWRLHLVQRHQVSM